MMKHWAWTGIVLSNLLITPALAAYKCVEDSGRVFYQDAPCPANTHGGDISRNVNRTFSGQAEPPAPLIQGEMAVTPGNEPAPMENEPNDEQPPQKILR